MQTKRVVPVLLLMLCCALAAMLSACGELSGYAAAPADPGITPVDTAPRYLNVNVKIIEDQDALTNKSSISISFSTLWIEDPNYYVIFDDRNEVVTCNESTTKLGNLPGYTLTVKRANYNCHYTGNKVDDPRNEASAQEQKTTFTVPTQTLLSPQLPTLTGNGFSLHYTPNYTPLYKKCTMSAMAFDRVSGDQTVMGSPMPDSGTYTTDQSISGLHGGGDIELTRTCKPQISASPFPFNQLSVTYITEASVEVTWPG